MRYCKKCLTRSTPECTFDSDGVCIACQYSGSTQTKKPKVRLDELIQKIRLTKNKIRRTSQYDCIVGVSGGKDSTRQAHWVRDRLGLNPLLVCASYPPLQMSEIGAQNLSNLLSMNFDLISLTPARKHQHNYLSDHSRCLVMFVSLLKWPYSLLFHG